MFFIEKAKEYYFLLYPSLGNIHPLGAFLLFSIGLVLASLQIVVIYPIIPNSDDQQQNTISQMRNDVDRFIERVRMNSVNLTDEFHWIDRLPSSLKFVSMQIQHMEYLHIICYVFAAYNSFFMELLFIKKINRNLFVLPLIFAIVVSYVDVQENILMFFITQSIQFCLSWIVFAFFLVDCINPNVQSPPVRNNRVNNHFHYM